jgi:hypothetical protein
MKNVGQEHVLLPNAKEKEAKDPGNQLLILLVVLLLLLPLRRSWRLLRVYSLDEKELGLVDIDTEADLL